MELDIKQVKPIIKSLLVSGKLTIKQLCQDFKKTVGCSLPFRKLGFGTAEEYLRSMPDIVSLSGTGDSAQIHRAVTKKSAHSKQKTKLPARQRRGVATPSPQLHASNGGNRINKTNVCYNNRRRASYTVPDGASRPSSANVEVGPNTTFRKYVKINVCIQKVETGYLLPRKQTKPNTSGNTHLPLTPDVYDEEEEEEDDELEDPEIISHYGSRRNEYPQEDKIESKIPSKIQDNLRQLIEDFPEGLWCAKLPYEYQKKFQQKLNYSQYQYPSVIELCADLPTIFGYVQPSIGDYLVFDRRRPMPNIEHLRHVRDIPTGQRDATTTISSEMPSFNWATEGHLLPTDAVRRGEHIEKTSLHSETWVGQIVCVTSGYAYDPTKFYIVLRTEQLTQMDKNLRAFFKHQGNTWAIPEQHQTEGVYCVVDFNGYFDRALIISALPELPGFIKVFLIDNGAVTSVPCFSIRYLPAMFKAPALAVRARLAEIWPPVSHSPWSMQASDRFRELMGGRESQKYFVAEIVHIDTEERCVEIYLQDKTDLDNRFYINEILCEERLAIYINQNQEQRYNDPASAPLGKFLYLAPSFEELETRRAIHQTTVPYAFRNRGSASDTNNQNTNYNSMPALQTHMNYSNGSEPYSNHYSNSNLLESLRVPPNFSSERNYTSPGTSRDSPSRDTAQNLFHQTNSFFNYHEDSSDDDDDSGSNSFLEGSEEPSQMNFRAQEMLSSASEERRVNSVGQNQVAWSSGNDGRNDTALRQDSQDTIRPPAGLYGLPLGNPALPVALAEALEPMELNPTDLQAHEIQQLREFARRSSSRMPQMAHSYSQLPNINPPGQNSSVSSFNPQLPFDPPFSNFAPNTVGGDFLAYLLHLKSALTHTNSVLDAAIGFAHPNDSS